MKLSQSARYIAGFLIVAIAIFLGTLTMRVARPYGNNPTIRRSLSQVPTLPPTKFLQNLEDVRQLEFCADGTRLITKARTGRISAYEVGSWRRIQQWKADFGMFYLSHDGKRLLVRGQSRDIVRTGPDYTTYTMWDVDSGKPISKWQSVYWRNAKSFLSFSSISPDLTRMIITEHERVINHQKRPLTQVRSVWIVDTANGKKLKRLPVDLSNESMLITNWLDQTLRIYGENTPIQFFSSSDWKPIPSLPKSTSIHYSLDKKLISWPVNGRNFAQFVEEKKKKQQTSSLAILNIQTQAKQQISTDFNFVFSVIPTNESLVVHAARNHADKKKVPHGEDTRYKSVIQFRSLDGQQIKTEQPGFIKRISLNRKVLIIATRYEATRADKAATYDIFRGNDGSLLYRLDRTANPLDGNWEEMFYYDGELGEKMELSPDGKWCVMSNMNGLMRIWELPSGKLQ